MGFVEEKSRSRLWRSVKTVFFLITLLISFLLFSAPVLLALADALLPFSLFSASLSPSPLSFTAISSFFRHYDFRYSLVDIPLVSLFRSAIILCVYSVCDGPKLSRGPYLSITMICSILSLIFVSLKAAYVFGDNTIHHGAYARTMEVSLFGCSLLLAVGHVVVAYRTSCKERRKLLVYTIDVEAVSAVKIGLPKHYRLFQEERHKRIDY